MPQLTLSLLEGGSRKGRALKPEVSVQVVLGEILPSLGSVCKNDMIMAVPLTGAAMTMTSGRAPCLSTPPHSLRHRAWAQQTRIPSPPSETGGPHLKTWRMGLLEPAGRGRQAWNIPSYILAASPPPALCQPSWRETCHRASQLDSPFET